MVNNTELLKQKITKTQFMKILIGIGNTKKINIDLR